MGGALVRQQGDVVEVGAGVGEDAQVAGDGGVVLHPIHHQVYVPRWCLRPYHSCHFRPVPSGGHLPLLVALSDICALLEPAHTLGGSCSVPLGMRASST